MAKDLSQKVTYILLSYLERERIQFRRIDFYKKPIVEFTAKRPHAIVKDDKKLDDTGIFSYEIVSSPSYSMFEKSIEYVYTTS
ncbi:MAG: hypothetical protein QW273_01665 [Candidatus Pacearchaeota archaeon]